MRVTLGSPGTVARPQSVSTTRPSSASSTLPGLMSRCTTPRRWAARNAPSMPSPMSATRAGGSGPSSARTSCNERLATYSITIHGSPSVRRTSKIRTTLTWLSRAIARASRNDRSRISWRSSVVSPGGGTSSLIATSRCRTSSCAFQTRPMPPWPSGSTSRYRSATMGCGVIDIGADRTRDCPRLHSRRSSYPVNHVRHPARVPRRWRRPDGRRTGRAGRGARDPHAPGRRPRAADLLVGTQRATRGYVPFLAGFGFAAITVYSGLHVPPRNR